MNGKGFFLVLGAGIWLAMIVACAPAAPPAPPSQPTALSSPAGAPTPKPAASVEKIKLAIPTYSVQYVPYRLGIDKGMFKEEGLDLQYAVMKAEIAVAAMLAGDMDFTGGVGSTVRSAAIGAPVRMIMATVNKSSFYLFTKTEIKSISELKGKTYGGSTLTGSATLIGKDVLRFRGIDPDKDMKVVATGDTATRLAALESGNIDITTLTPPFDSLAKKRGLKLFAWAGEIGETLESGVGTPLKRIVEKPGQVKAYIKATLKGINYFLKNREEMIPFLMKEFDLERDVATDAYESTATAFSPNGMISDKAVQGLIEEARKLANIKQEIPLAQVVDFTMLKEAQKDLGIK